MPGDWSENEVRLTVADYFDMLTAELRGERYNKAEHRDKLWESGVQRSDGAIEFKHENISAVLSELGLPWINGYKPHGNYQRLLAEAVREYLDAHPDPLAIASEAPPKRSWHRSDFDAEEAPPERSSSKNADTPKEPSVRRYDWDEQERKNREVGHSGEEFVVYCERERLERLGRADLASMVQWVSEDLGDGAGYDIRSYNADGSICFVEVKTTSCGKMHPFFISASELAFARRHGDDYVLYRVYDFRSRRR